ncbi:MAG TPA: alpha/beta fold hydrolase [Acidimicrobiales bacterium]
MAIDEVVRERRVRGAGLDLFVGERGDAEHPTVLLIHGFPDTSAVWTPLAERLSADHHVVTYDVRGAGRSDVPTKRADFDLALLVQDVAAVADAVSPSKPVHLVAHDWGSIQGWEAVVTPGLDGRFASYTSISGPPIDHAGLKLRVSRGGGFAELRKTLSQALHSWYIAFFHLPVLPKLMARGSRTPKLWAAALHRIEGVQGDAEWPAPTFGADFEHGIDLYRANIRPRLRHPVRGHATCPVQLIVPLKDRYVTPALIEGLEDWAPVLWRRSVPAGHWVVRTHPDLISEWVRQVVAYVESGTTSPELEQARIA